MVLCQFPKLRSGALRTHMARRLRARSATAMPSRAAAVQLRHQRARACNVHPYSQRRHPSNATPSQARGVLHTIMQSTIVCLVQASIRMAPTTMAGRCPAPPGAPHSQTPSLRHREAPSRGGAKRMPSRSPPTAQLPSPMPGPPGPRPPLERASSRMRRIPDQVEPRDASSSDALHLDVGAVLEAPRRIDR